MKEYIIIESVKNLFNYYQKSKEIAKNEGLPILVKKGGRWLKARTYTANEAMWYCRLLDNTLSETKKSEVNVIIAEEPEFDNWLQQHQRAFPWIYIEQEVSATRNDLKLPFVAKIRNQIVAYVKVAGRNAYILDYDTHMPLPHHVAFIQDTFVLPKFRHNGVAQYTISKAMTDLKSKRFSKIFCHIPKWNEASIRTYSSLGFKPCGHVRFFRLFRSKIYSTKPEILVRTAQCK